MGAESEAEPEAEPEAGYYVYRSYNPRFYGRSYYTGYGHKYSGYNSRYYKNGGYRYLRTPYGNKNSFAFVYNTALSYPSRFQTMPSGRYPVQDIPSSLVAPSFPQEKFSRQQEKSKFFPEQEIPSSLVAPSFPQEKFSRQQQGSKFFPRQQEGNPAFLMRQGSRFF